MQMWLRSSLQASRGTQNLSIVSSLRNRCISSQAESPPAAPLVSSRSHLQELANQLETEHTKRYVADEEYVHLLRACPRFKALSIARQVHACIVNAALDNRVFLCNHLIHTYGKCGSLDDAWATFEAMQYRNLYTWTTIIGACSSHHSHPGAMLAFRCMQLEGVKPDSVTLLAAITACERPPALPAGKRLHAYVAESGFDLILENALITMYGSCGSVEDARNVFDGMVTRNVITWTAMIGAYAGTSLPEAFTMFQKMELEGFKSNYVTYVTLVQGCSSPEFLEVGKLIHARSILSSAEMETPLCNALITMYGRCARLDEAEAIFYGLREKDLISWNALITEYGQHGFTEQAVELYQLMHIEGVKPDKVTFLALLTMSDGPEVLTDVKLLHSHVLESGVAVNVALGTALVTMYAKYESLEDTRCFFESMPQRNVVSWNVMVSAYAKHGFAKKTAQVADHMHLEGVKPDSVTCVGLLNVCTCPADLPLGRKIHSWIAEGRCEADLILKNALLNMYGRCGKIEDVEAVFFDEITEHNVISWTGMITAYSRHNMHREALVAFHGMQLNGVRPSSVTFLEAISACAGRETLATGRLVHSCAAESGSHTEVTLGSALVAMYGRCGSVEEANRCFQAETTTKNQVTWSAMIAAYVLHGREREGLQLFQNMQLNGFKSSAATFATLLTACGCLASLAKGKAIHRLAAEAGVEAEVTVVNALTTMYGKCGSLLEARTIFEKSRRHDIVSWNAIISAYAQHGEARAALELYYSMQLEGLTPPDTITFISILSVCSHVGLLEEGVYSYAGMLELGIQPTQDHYACVIDLLGRAGKLQEAEEFIQSLRVRPAAVTLTSFLGSCRSHGDLERGKRTAHSIMELNPKSSSAHVVLSSIYLEDGGDTQDVV